MKKLIKAKEKPTWTKRDWIPIRRGDLYCSPACGGNCTIEHYERAIDAANSVAHDLGTGWKARVHENLGWYARVVSPCGRISITLPLYGRDNGYTAFLGPKENQLAGKWAEHGRTPREAIDNVLNAARRDLGLIEGIVKGLEVPAIRTRRQQRLSA